MCEEQRRHCLKEILVQSSQAFTRSIGKMFVSLLSQGKLQKTLGQVRQHCGVSSTLTEPEKKTKNQML